MDAIGARDTSATSGCRTTGGSADGRSLTYANRCLCSVPCCRRSEWDGRCCCTRPRSPRVRLEPDDWRDREPRSRNVRLGAVGAVFREAPRFFGFLGRCSWCGRVQRGVELHRAPDRRPGGGAFLVAARHGARRRAGTLHDARLRPLQERWRAAQGLHARLLRLRRRVLAVGCGVSPFGAVDPTMFEASGSACRSTTSVVVVGRLIPKHLSRPGTR